MAPPRSADDAPRPSRGWSHALRPVAFARHPRSEPTTTRSVSPGSRVAERVCGLVCDGWDQADPAVQAPTGV